MSISRKAVYAPAPGTTRNVSQKLDVDKQGTRLCYCNGRNVVVRSLQDEGLAFDYSGHTATTTVARFSPSGAYIASGDSTGQVRVWDVSQGIQIYHQNPPVLKLQLQVISGPIRDLAWDGESARVIAVGSGRDRFGHAFAIDGGNSVGEILGHSKVINAVAVRQSRPFKAVTASDDQSLVFYQGAPYRFVKTIKGVHSNFINDVAYSPDGNHFVSAGTDSKLVLYDGKTGDVLAELKSGAGAGHKGTIYAVAWSKDGKQVVSSGADGTVRMWDIDTKENSGTWECGAGLENQQVGVVWAKENLICALSFDGTLRFLDPEHVGTIDGKSYEGLQKGITSLTYLSKEALLVAGSYDGLIASFDLKTGKSRRARGDRHRNQITSLTVRADACRSAGMDDTIRRVKAVDGGLEYFGESIKVSNLPKTVCAGAERLYVNLTETIEVIDESSSAKIYSTKHSLLTIALSADEKLLACGTEDAKTLIYDTASMTLKETLSANRGGVSALAFSPDGAWLAAGDSQGRIMLYDVRDGFKLKTSHWVFHTGRVTSIDWTADGKHAASGALDSHVYIWSVEKTMKNIAIKNVHLGGTNGVVWCGETTLASAGADACIKLHEVVHV